MPGCVLQVQIERMGGGSPSNDFWNAAIPNHALARDAVLKALGNPTDVTVEVVSDLTDGALKELGLEPGQVAPVPLDVPGEVVD